MSPICRQRQVCRSAKVTREPSHDRTVSPPGTIFTGGVPISHPLIITLSTPTAPRNPRRVHGSRAGLLTDRRRPNVPHTPRGLIGPETPCFVPAPSDRGLRPVVPTGPPTSPTPIQSEDGRFAAVAAPWPWVAGFSPSNPLRGRTTLTRGYTPPVVRLQSPTSPPPRTTQPPRTRGGGLS